MLTLELATNRVALAWTQGMVTKYHYLRTPVDARCSPVAYCVDYHYSWGAGAAAGPRTVGILIFGRMEATRCYNGKLTYGDLDDVAAGRARYSRWEVLNLARVWFHDCTQPGGTLHGPEHDLPGFVDRRGVWRSTLVSWAIREALGGVGFDYLRLKPPVFVEEPYQIRAILSYCDTRLHKGTIYRASGFQLARTNDEGIETWYTPAVAPLASDQDTTIRKLASQTARGKRLRGERAEQAQQESFL